MFIHRYAELGGTESTRTASLARSLRYLGPNTSA